jgi:hypothetical protein
VRPPISAVADAGRAGDLAKDREDRAVVRCFFPALVIDDFCGGEIHIATERAVDHGEVDARVDIVRRPVVSPCVLLGVLGGDGREVGGIVVAAGDGSDRTSGARVIEVAVNCDASLRVSGEDRVHVLAEQSSFVLADGFLVAKVRISFGFQVDADEAVVFAVGGEAGVEDAASHGKGCAFELKLQALGFCGGSDGEA